MEINEFFNELNYSIQNAKTKKTLRVLSRRAKKFTNEASTSPYCDKVTKKVVKTKYRESLNNIKIKTKLLK